MSGTIKLLQKAQLINLTDAATVVRRQDGKVKVKQAMNLVGAGVLAEPSGVCSSGYCSSCPGWD